MDKKYSLVIALLITGIIFLDIFFFNNFIKRDNKAIEKVVLSRVIDGDTIVLGDNRTIRLLNINSPEKGTHNAELSKDFLKKFENQSIKLVITGIDKYSRNLARIYSLDLTYLNLELVKKGLASKFLVDKNELSIFSNAELNAIKNSQGMWNKSEYFNCFESSINKEKELVAIKNHCSTISFNGWYLKDESRKIYLFNNIYLGSIILHSNVGEDNETDVFWNSKQDIWNNDRDSLYLFDEKDKIVHYQSYGY
ncbi:MAG: thermonuclease family protein [Nanoarchaeota archaeon]